MSRPKHYHLYTDLGDILVNLDGYHSKFDSHPDANGCMNWHGPLHRQGYGMIGAIRKSDQKRIMVTAHRVAGRLKAGHALAQSDTVVHSCSNPKCQNPAHILIGNLSLRNKIAVQNGRMCGGTGMKKAGVEYKQNRQYKFTEDEIRFLRTATTEEICDRFGWDSNKAANNRWYAKSLFKWLKD